MNSLFEQFQGADLDRLTDCLKAIRAAGLYDATRGAA